MRGSSTDGLDQMVLAFWQTRIDRSLETQNFKVSSFLWPLFLLPLFSVGFDSDLIYIRAIFRPERKERRLKN